MEQGNLAHTSLMRQKARFVYRYRMHAIHGTHVACCMVPVPIVRSILFESS